MKMICSLCKKEVELSEIMTISKREYCRACVYAVMESIKDSRISLENALKTALALVGKGNIPDDGESGLK